MRQLFNKALYLVWLGISVINPTTLASDMNTTLQTVAKAQPRFIACEVPRPIMCQQSYDPVCGFYNKATNKSQTFRNSCLACLNTNVQGFEYGRCTRDFKR